MISMINLMAIFDVIGDPTADENIVDILLGAIVGLIWLWLQRKGIFKNFLKN